MLIQSSNSQQEGLLLIRQCKKERRQELQTPLSKNVELSEFGLYAHRYILPLPFAVQQAMALLLASRRQTPPQGGTSSQ